MSTVLYGYLRHILTYSHSCLLSSDVSNFKQPHNKFIAFPLENNSKEIHYCYEFFLNIYLFKVHINSGRIMIALNLQVVGLDTFLLTVYISSDFEVFNSFGRYLMSKLRAVHRRTTPTSILSTNEKCRDLKIYFS